MSATHIHTAKFGLHLEVYEQSFRIIDDDGAAHAINWVGAPTSRAMPVIVEQMVDDVYMAIYKKAYKAAKADAINEILHQFKQTMEGRK